MKEIDIQALIRDLGSDDWEVRRDAILALAHAASKGQDIAPAIPALGNALSDKNKFVRWDSAQALVFAAKNDQDITPATSALANALCNEDIRVRYNATLALMHHYINKEDFSSALKTIKNATFVILKSYSGKKDRNSLNERREELTKFESFTQQIHDKMNIVDNDKKFPVKRQEVRIFRKRIRNG